MTKDEAVAVLRAWRAEIDRTMGDADLHPAGLRAAIDVACASVTAAPTRSPPYPVPMILHCPWCSERHIDAGEFATKPHHTHACQSCGEVWRPAIVPTVGVQFLPGFKDEVR